jgi:cellobiose-specific phosphotransferase system component IIC
MVAGLLYVVGLIVLVATVVIVGVHSPALLQSFITTLQTPEGGPMAAVVQLGDYLNWALMPFVGGLVLMGFGRTIMLLHAINRALRGTP